MCPRGVEGDGEHQNAEGEEECPDGSEEALPIPCFSEVIQYLIEDKGTQ